MDMTNGGLVTELNKVVVAKWTGCRRKCEADTLGEMDAMASTPHTHAQL